MEWWRRSQSNIRAHLWDGMSAGAELKRSDVGVLTRSDCVQMWLRWRVEPTWYSADRVDGKRVQAKRKPSEKDSDGG